MMDIKECQKLLEQHDHSAPLPIQLVQVTNPKALQFEVTFFQRSITISADSFVKFASLCSELYATPQFPEHILKSELTLSSMNQIAYFFYIVLKYAANKHDLLATLFSDQSAADIFAKQLILVQRQAAGILTKAVTKLSLNSSKKSTSKLLNIAKGQANRNDLIITEEKTEFTQLLSDAQFQLNCSKNLFKTYTDYFEAHVKGLREQINASKQLIQAVSSQAQHFDQHYLTDLLPLSLLSNSSSLEQQNQLNQIEQFSLVLLQIGTKMTEIAQKYVIQYEYAINLYNDSLGKVKQIQMKIPLDTNQLSQSTAQAAEAQKNLKEQKTQVEKITATIQQFCEGELNNALDTYQKNQAQSFAKQAELYGKNAKIKLTQENSQFTMKLE
ncbi:Hypothetical_protein [Hexamita inflata]|uniref:Hypothetical_protein n=1 Tax=Hexamita inflata TaxID=28002 RepID=A0AA86PEZ7_9EUKA|nr:Hypothetical protein HINF_LOCUS4993 [Hexamita inflata]CAI9937726.1 Hypothetical protein HINF_LOCUS25371 [Hexamita inflata]